MTVVELIRNIVSSKPFFKVHIDPSINTKFERKQIENIDIGANTTVFSRKV